MWLFTCSFERQESAPYPVPYTGQVMACALQCGAAAVHDVHFSGG